MQPSDQKEIFNVLAAIMHIGNLAFFTGFDITYHPPPHHHHHTPATNPCLPPCGIRACNGSLLDLPADGDTGEVKQLNPSDTEETLRPRSRLCSRPEC